MLVSIAEHRALVLLALSDQRAGLRTGATATSQSVCEKAGLGDGREWMDWVSAELVGQVSESE